MSMGKKKNDATKKKGLAINDDALEGVTGGGLKIVYRRTDGRLGTAWFYDPNEAKSWRKDHQDYELIKTECCGSGPMWNPFDSYTTD